MTCLNKPSGKVMCSVVRSWSDVHLCQFASLTDSIGITATMALALNEEDAETELELAKAAEDPGLHFRTGLAGLSCAGSTLSCANSCCYGGNAIYASQPITNAKTIKFRQLQGARYFEVGILASDSSPFDTDASSSWLSGYNGVTYRRIFPKSSDYHSENQATNRALYLLNMDWITVEIDVDERLVRYTVPHYVAPGQPALKGPGDSDSADDDGRGAVAIRGAAFSDETIVVFEDPLPATGDLWLGVALTHGGTVSYCFDDQLPPK
eukprot:m.39416 g.39416  ORF g.39416 m.39416 type:complete len:266 (+) comp11271_c0_seq1:1360-2157(+)